LRSGSSSTPATTMRESSASFRCGSPNAAPRRNCCVRSSGNSKNRGSINRLLAAELHGLTAAMRECTEELRRTHRETGVAGRGLRELSAGTPLATTTIKTVLGAASLANQPWRGGGVPAILLAPAVPPQPRPLFAT